MFFASSLSGVAGPTWKTSSTDGEPSITISVQDAYYGDLDDDGQVDDTFASVELFINGFNRVNFDYYITLTLPSGLDFLFGLGINTKYTYLEINSTMFNTALEPGWYHLHVEIVRKTGGMYYHDAEHIFDPPGDGQDGSKPWDDHGVTGY